MLVEPLRLVLGLADEVIEVLDRDFEIPVFVVAALLDEFKSETLTHLVDVLLERPDAGRAAIILDQIIARLLRNVEFVLVVLEARLLDGLRVEVLVEDMLLLLECVAGDLNDLHAVENGGMHRVQVVRRAQE